MIKIKRAYEQASPKDGYRVLVDRLWPRGIRKEDLLLHAWLKELAPSDELRRSFAHDTARWVEFGRRYRRELASEAAREALAGLASRARRGTVTLVYGARDEAHNNAVVLRDVLTKARSDRRAA